MYLHKPELSMIGKYHASSSLVQRHNTGIRLLVLRSRDCFAAIAMTMLFAFASDGATGSGMSVETAMNNDQSGQNYRSVPVN